MSLRFTVCISAGHWTTPKLIRIHFILYGVQLCKKWVNRNPYFIVATSTQKCIQKLNFIFLRILCLARLILIFTDRADDDALYMHTLMFVLNSVGIYLLYNFFCFVSNWKHCPSRNIVFTVYVAELSGSHWSSTVCEPEVCHSCHFSPFLLYVFCIIIYVRYWFQNLIIICIQVKSGIFCAVKGSTHILLCLHRI
jgi:hypothetical protein